MTIFALQEFMWEAVLQNYFLVGVIMKAVRNTVEGARFHYFVMARFVRAVEWH